MLQRHGRDDATNDRVTAAPVASIAHEPRTKTIFSSPRILARESQMKRVSGTVYMYIHGLKRADTGYDQGARVFTIRIAVKYFAFLHSTSGTSTISFIGLNFDASRVASRRLFERKRETIEIGDYRRTILGPPSFRPTTLPVLKTIITFKHEQHTLQRYTDTRTWPNVLGTCTAAFTSTQKHTYYTSIITLARHQRACERSCSVYACPCSDLSYETSKSSD